MSRIDRIKVAGFWGTYDFETKIFPDVTFLIGANGTGKTTLINLIAAALVGDFITLERTSFSSIEISLSASEPNKKPLIQVTKKADRNQPYKGIRYLIRSPTGDEQEFSLDEVKEHFYIREEASNYLVVQERLQRGRRRYQPKGLVEALRGMIEVSWLSIHRTANLQWQSDEKSYESTVDKKLEQLTVDLARYFSALNGQKDEDVQRFQEFIFLSLLEESQSDAFAIGSNRNLLNQRAALIDIFKELRVSDDTFGPRLEKYFGEAEAVTAKLKNKIQSFSQHEFAFLIGLQRLDNIIEKWRDLQSRLSSIFLQRHRFIETVNSLFRNKTIGINKENQLVVETSESKILTTNMLSSGEKQLLILLAEALLQRNRPMLFIADEPELSLHVSWQEKLVSSIRTVNPEAQIVMATHSPDIVGALSKNIVDMETLTA